MFAADKRFNSFSKGEMNESGLLFTVRNLIWNSNQMVNRLLYIIDATGILKFISLQKDAEIIILTSIITVRK